jgi:hypothetical protein
MKYPVIFLAAFLFLSSFGFSAYSEINNPYPPPVGTETGTTNGSYENGATGSEILADLILVRPVSLLAYLIGAAASVVATPFVLASPEKDAGYVYRTLLNEPFDFTVLRPLGDFPEPVY